LQVNSQESNRDAFDHFSECLEWLAVERGVMKRKLLAVRIDCGEYVYSS